jgi:hypothetical protein
VQLLGTDVWWNGSTTLLIKTTTPETDRWFGLFKSAGGWKQDSRHNPVH